ncbi:hypothetical protein MPH_11407 [Macrophomina phaseolina MS6]|uniref:DUF4604 domain-containing protein n=1 Tax=Macrophomina phaseolina (strain MS6) TaxID=1126212 RepID=K2RAJ8_MACPH|nr:hypothetical protein MPH_11407 [Macrophomina phaseolina MS6]
MEEREEDRRRAELIDFGVDGTDGDVEAAALKAAARPLFEEQSKSTSPTPIAKGKTKAERTAEMSKQLLQQKLKGNTRAAMDPFSTERATSGPRAIAGIKRKRAATENSKEKSTTLEKPPSSKEQGPETQPEKKALALVSYDSEDDE